MANEPPPPTADAAGARAARRRRLAGLAAVAAYLAIAAGMVCLSRDQLNPDAVSYLRSARYYAAGRLDLAVNSWFSPLLSWLLVPAAGLGANLVLTAKVLNVLLGLAVAAGAVALARRIGVGRRGLLTGVCGLLLALTMLPWPVTPDLLLTCLVTWYLVASAPLLGGGSARRAFAVGLLGGVCYLAKAYALPFVTAHLAMTFLLRRLAARRGGPRPRVLGPLAAALAGLATAALPWVAVISGHDGRLTICSANAETFTPRPVEPLPMQRIQRPRTGRISIWENPVENTTPWDHWPPLLSGYGLAIRAEAFANHVWRALGWLKGIDALGLLVAGWVASLVLAVPLRRRLAEPASALRVWACASAVIFVGGYMLVYVEDRFLWPVWPLLLALATTALALLDTPEAAAGRTRRAMTRALAVLLVASVAYRTACTLERWASRYGPGGQATFLRTTARRFGLDRPVVANEWHAGLAVCYWRDAVFLGRFLAATPDAIAEELTPVGPVNVLIIWDKDLMAALADDDRFELLDCYEDLRTESVACLLAFDPPPP